MDLVVGRDPFGWNQDDLWCMQPPPQQQHHHHQQQQSSSSAMPPNTIAHTKNPIGLRPRCKGGMALQWESNFSFIISIIVFKTHYFDLVISCILHEKSLSVGRQMSVKLLPQL